MKWHVSPFLACCSSNHAGIVFAPDEASVLEELNMAIEGIVGVVQQVDCSDGVRVCCSLIGYPVTGIALHITAWL
jgi:hypothetical protein